MDLERRRKKAKKSSGGRKRNCISELPDAVLKHILGFLPAHEAVKTSLLARRWRHLWKSATTLRIHHHPAQEPVKKNIREFVKQILRLRGSSALDECEIILLDFDDQDVPSINRWIKRVLKRQVQALTLRFYRNRTGQSSWLPLNDRPLVSQHLTRLKLFDLCFNDKFLDFSRCPALEELEIDSCFMASVHGISSQSLKRLSIGPSCILAQTFRNRISAPNLASLHLEVDFGRAPVLDEMPLLQDALVEISYSMFDSCRNSDESGSSDNNDDDYYNYDNNDDDYYEIDGDDDTCVLLQGLSQANNLALISDTKMLVFKRDLNWCPTFSNLKTLLLNEYWCKPADDFSALTCILEHSPVLERLTLQLFCKGAESKIKMKELSDPRDRSAAISKYLQIVEIKCELIDKEVLTILKFLKSQFNICKIEHHYL
ncbi:hypothetical protein EJB05_58091, partial [Eragrostis curvula]